MGWLIAGIICLSIGHPIWGIIFILIAFANQNEEY